MFPPPTSRGTLPAFGRALLALVLAAGAALALPQPPAEAGGALALIVRKQPGAGSAPERLVAALGGRVGRPLGIIDGFSALLPARALASLKASPAVAAVSVDGGVRLMGRAAPASAPATMYHVAQETGATTLWSAGITGRGVDVAMIDSGVAPVPGLNAAGKVINGPDLSFESQSPYHRYLDTFGHGTHMAGIIAGRDAGWTPATAATSFAGMAPDARLLSLKVADANGATDVSQVIAAIDWVVQHRTDHGMNIRVLNLSFGTSTPQSYLLDPLSFAAEVAWANGIVVVAATGNAGSGGRSGVTSSSTITSPGIDPFVLSVGAQDTKGTESETDDVVPSFSSQGDNNRRVDLIAPGKSIESLANPGSFLDTAYPGGRSGSRFFKGSGTSQAAAVLSGAIALLVQKYPSATPDQLKRQVLTGAAKIFGANPDTQGAGALDLVEAIRGSLPTVTNSRQTATVSSGTGSLDLSRGGTSLEDAGVVLSGERDIFGRAFDVRAWTAAATSRKSWSGGSWNGSAWAGTSWSGDQFASCTWSGTSWGGTAWSSVTYSGTRWSGTRWSGGDWSSAGWE